MDHPESPNSEPAKPDPAPPAPPPATKKADAEQLAQRLRAAVRQHRPRFIAWLTLLLVLLAIPLGLWLWWAWPRTQPPRLAVIAFDQLKESVSGRREVLAQFVPAEPGEG